MTKLCPKCKKEYPKTKEYFHKHKNMTDGFYTYCKECCIDINRDKHYKKKYNITLKKYNELFNRCNRLLGFCNDNKLILFKAIKYLSG